MHSRKIHPLPRMLISMYFINVALPRIQNNCVNQMDRTIMVRGMKRLAFGDSTVTDKKFSCDVTDYKRSDRRSP